MKKPSFPPIFLAISSAGLIACLIACGAAQESRETSESQSSESRAAEAESSGSGARAIPARDLILITLDTLRYDALAFSVTEGVDAGIHATPVPNLERLAAEGVSFTFALAHNTITLPSHANILTGRYPFEHGLRENAAYTLPESAPSAAELFAAEGFATGAFVSAYVLDSSFGLAEGFEVYDDRIARDFAPSALRVWERRAPQTIDAALEWWQANGDRRRFLWLHLFEPHTPYDPPEPFDVTHGDAPYRGEVAALDHFLGRLFEVIGSEQEAPFLVVTADHGESLGDHGEPAHGIFAYQSTLHVPLILSGPGLMGNEPGSPRRDERLARHIDILPTLLQAAGLEAPAGLTGRSLLSSAGEGLTSYFEALSATFDSGWAPLRGLVQGHLKVIDLPIPELYDLASDPGEQQNLVEQRRRDFHRLRSLLPAESSWPPPRGTLSDEAAARLRSLGYLSDDSSVQKVSFGVEDDPKRWIHVETLKQQYAEQVRSGQAKAAVATARAVLREQPRMSLAQTMLAEALLAAGDEETALQTMRRAWEQDLASPSLTRRLASTWLREGQPRLALEVISKIAGAEDAATRSLHGQILRENGRPREAAVILRSVIEQFPDDALSLERLSAVALDLGRPAEAGELATQALELDSQLAEAWNNLGVARVMLGEIDQGLEAWARALEIDPELWDTLYNLGFQAARAGRSDLARDALERFIAGAPPSRYGVDLPKAEALRRQLGNR